ncbi:hypothetical protein CONLIGDRAFT_637090 [Coniochaeta ligniaria NRRL 30616]|uniref:Uncharacterized protein n=1 Tax=Coniochaeta ligniaria NRRL 30616 TaxID=1408157 RepID=A0A1J7J1X6_9PEZI|nr:hypothetical protein CONLIGDRAFT_637090 [Coniochaeta ligniaria NRRL 30616]
MSFNAIAAVGAGTDLFQAIQLDAPLAGRSNIRTLVARNDSSGSTVNLFIDALSPDMQYAASIVEACVERTVYAIHCTKGPSSIGSATCNPNAPIATLTEGPSTYAFSSAISTRTAGNDLQGTLQEGCVLAGTTAANCSATVAATLGGTSTVTSTTTAVSGTDYYRFDVAITGGAEKTASPTACKSSGAAGLSAKAVAVWGLIGAIGVAGFLGC